MNGINWFHRFFNQVCARRLRLTSMLIRHQHSLNLGEKAPVLCQRWGVQNNEPGRCQSLLTATGFKLN